MARLGAVLFLWILGAAILGVLIDAARAQTTRTYQYYDKDGPYSCSGPETVTVPHDSSYKQQSRSSGGTDIKGATPVGLFVSITIVAVTFMSLAVLTSS